MAARGARLKVADYTEEYRPHKDIGERAILVCWPQSSNRGEDRSVAWNGYPVNLVLVGRCNFGCLNGMISIIQSRASRA